MKGKIGKVGGRVVNKEVKVNTCVYCGKEDETVIRVKSGNSNGKNRMIWECKSCLGM